MMKRKKIDAELDPGPSLARPRKSSKTETAVWPRYAKFADTQHVQVVIGTYDRTIQGIVATVPEQPEVDHLWSNSNASDNFVEFEPNFHFDAHKSAIRCLAISPLNQLDETDNPKTALYLASGSTDGVVQVYQLDASSPPALHRRPTNGHQNIKNARVAELGALTHHYSSINVLDFPSRTKLLSGSDDSTIAVSRTRDLSVLSSFKVPIPKAVGRPSGDTAPLGSGPSGVNSFSIHPSRKLMISVGRGEKCMRLWNLVTGKKAGVLTFERDLLFAVGERKGARGEGLGIQWNDDGDEFIVVFERGAAIFDMSCKPKGIFRPSPSTKLHRTRYVPSISGSYDVFVLATEDGRLLFVSSHIDADESSREDSELPLLHTIGHIGKGGGRIKDFEIVYGTVMDKMSRFLIVAANSDGTLRIWHVDLVFSSSKHDMTSKPTTVRGSILGTFKTESRITCLKAFLMHPTLNSASTVILTSSPADETTNGQENPGPLERDSEDEFQGLGSDED